jgi:hypothetical protein
MFIQIAYEALRLQTHDWTMFALLRHRHVLMLNEEFLNERRLILPLVLSCFSDWLTDVSSWETSNLETL